MTYDPAQPHYPQVAHNYDSIAESHDYPRVAHSLVDLFRECAIPLVFDTRVLDVGCGTGLLRTVFEKAQPDIDVIGFEPEASMIARCVEKFSAHSNPKIVQGALKNTAGLPFQNETFDIVASCGVLEHVDVTPALTHELFRVIRPGGHLAITYEQHLQPQDRQASWSPNRIVTSQSLSKSYMEACLKESGATILRHRRLPAYERDTKSINLGFLKIIFKVERTHYGLVLARKPL